MLNIIIPHDEEGKKIDLSGSQIVYGCQIDLWGMEFSLRVHRSVNL